jgi:esterase/lipase superfamily enzyme
MGNLGLLRALTSVTASAALSGVRFGQIFIAAPDIDINLFRNLANIYPKMAMRTTLYISAIDHALGTSQFVNRNQRVGYSPPVTVIDGIDTIEATNVDLGLLGHGYYAAAVTVLHDMFALMRRDEPPAKRFGLLEQTTSEGERYWVLRPHLR